MDSLVTDNLMGSLTDSLALDNLALVSLTVSHLTVEEATVRDGDYRLATFLDNCYRFVRGSSVKYAS